jgi:predicted RNA-binding Zn-ribbon protein involved in translation (DUF1610 family)
MTHDQLIKIIKTQRKSNEILSFMFIFLFFGLLIVFLIAEKISNGFSPSFIAWLNISTALIFLIGITFIIARITISNKKLINVCPHCGKSLITDRLACVAIATGRCGNCGKEIVKVQEDEPHA